MIDPLGPLRWDLRSNGRLRIRHHIDDLAAQTPLVKLERRLALAVEREVRVDLHMLIPPDPSLWDSSDTPSKGPLRFETALRRVPPPYARGAWFLQPAVER